jgi:uncharacterized C2H2 Zn-finger protein
MSGATNLTSKPEAFTCPMCGRTFESKQTLDAHKNKEHSMTPEPPAGVT